MHPSPEIEKAPSDRENGNKTAKRALGPRSQKYWARRVFLGKTTPVACVNSDPPPAMSAVLIVLMLGCLVAPAIGIPLVQWIGR